MKTGKTLNIFLLVTTAILFGIDSFIKAPFFGIIAILLTLLISVKARIITAHSLKFIQTIKYCSWLIIEIFWSAINVTKIAWQPELNLKPVVKWISSKQQTDLGLVIYANSITLTPGTITIEMNNNNLLIHALDGSGIDDLQAGIMDDKVLNIIK